MCEERHKRQLQGLEEPAAAADDPASSFDALGEMHPQWDKMEKSERRAWEKNERERRLREFSVASGRPYESPVSKQLPAHPAGSDGQLDGMMDGGGSFRKRGRGSSAAFLAMSFDDGDDDPYGLIDPAPKKKGGMPAADIRHSWSVLSAVPMDEEGMRLRALALRRGARSGVEDSDLMLEEQAEVWLQEALVAELSRRSGTAEGTKGVDAAAAAAAGELCCLPHCLTTDTDPLPSAEAAKAAGHPAAPLLTLIAELFRARPVAGRRALQTAAELAAEAAEQLARSRVVSEGPPRCAASRRLLPYCELS